MTSESVWGGGHGECESHDVGQVEGQCQDRFGDEVSVRLRIRVRVRVRVSMHSERSKGGGQGTGNIRVRNRVKSVKLCERMRVSDNVVVTVRVKIRDMARYSQCHG